MSTEIRQFYENDVVFRFVDKKRVAYGVVCATYEEEDEEDTSRPLKKGFLRVVRANSSREHIWRQSKVRLVSRNVIPGDIVRRLVHGRETQRGYCRDARQWATVRIVGAHDQVVERVAADRLRPVWPYECGAAVRLRGFYGRVQSFDQLLTLRARCGSMVMLLAGEQTDVEDLWLSRGGGRHYSDQFYQGQQVVCVPRRLEQANWIFKSRRMKKSMYKNTRFTIVKVSPIDVEVAWDGESPANAKPIKESSTGGGGGGGVGVGKEESKIAVPPPPSSDKKSRLSFSTISSDDLDELKVLSPLETKYVEFGERRFLKLSASDYPFKKQDEWIRKQSMRARRLDAASGGGNLPERTLNRLNSELSDDGWQTEEALSDSAEESTEQQQHQKSNKPAAPAVHRHATNRHRQPTSQTTVPVEVICIETAVTVVWQDGTEEKDIPSTELYYSISLDDHEFFPGECVRRESDKDSEKDNPSSASSYGVVQSVDYLERLAKIRWFTEAGESDGPVQTVSVYDVRKHPRYSFRPGSVVRTNDDGAEPRMGYVVDGGLDGRVVVRWACSDDDATGGQQPGGRVENCALRSIKLIPDVIDVVEELDDDDDVDDLDCFCGYLIGDCDAGDGFDKASQVSWETESVETLKDATAPAAGTPDDFGEGTAVVGKIATLLDFVRDRVLYLREAFQRSDGALKDSITMLKDLITIYDNCSFLDKLLDTDFFTQKSCHYQTLIQEVKEKAKAWGVEFRGRPFTFVAEIFTGEQPSPAFMAKAKAAEHETISKLTELESRVNARLTRPPEDEAADPTKKTKDNDDKEEAEGEEKKPTPREEDPKAGGGGGGCSLCLELLHMLELRLNLVYAELMARLHGDLALTGLVGAAGKAPTAPPATAPGAKPPPPSMFPSPPAEKKAEPTAAAAAAVADREAAFSVLEEAPLSHRFYPTKTEPKDRAAFLRCLQREHRLLEESLPPGILARTFQDRLDLFSVMVVGPAGTPYEDALFCFELQLGPNYPKVPPGCFYLSYSAGRVNPNLYVEGHVCLSLLGTWSGKGSEVWGPKSTLLQLLVSIQGLILVREPYFNEAGYEKQLQSQQGSENSRIYNEVVLLKVIESITRMAERPPAPFAAEVGAHFARRARPMADRLNAYCAAGGGGGPAPDFPLLPVSRGFTISLGIALERFLKTLEEKRAPAAPAGGC